MERIKLKQTHKDLIDIITDSHSLNFFGIKERNGEIFSKYLKRQIKMSELGDEYDLSDVRIRQIIRKCLKDIRINLEKVPALKNTDYGRPIEELDIKRRTYMCLKSAGLDRIANLAGMEDHDLLKLRNFGKKSLMDLKHELGKYGINF